MRVLLLLSALLTSLCGVVTGVACAASPVEASQSIGEREVAPAKAAISRAVAAEPRRDAPRWRVAATPQLTATRPLYADSLRE